MKARKRVVGMLPAMARRIVDFLVEGLSFGVPAIEMPERMRRCIETRRLLARVPPMEQTFSADSAREILTFIVRANMAALVSQLSPGTHNATRT